jgi:hypothetical protein
MVAWALLDFLRSQRTDLSVRALKAWEGGKDKRSLGYEWLQGFKKRHEATLASSGGNTADLQRIEACSKETATRYLTKLEESLQSAGFLDSRGVIKRPGSILNVDEKPARFCTGGGNQVERLFLKGKSRTVHAVESKQTRTLTAAISLAGKMYKPQLILREKTSASLPSNLLDCHLHKVEDSEHGFQTQKSFLQFLKVLVREVRRSNN